MSGKKRPWWVWVLVVLVGLAVLGAIIGDDEKKSENTASQQTTTDAPEPIAEQSTTTTTPESPAQTIGDARQAVDEDDYDQAIVIATAISAAETDAIRERISNRLARRSLTALRAGSRGRARTLLIEANDYPMTTQKQYARASYKATKARAAQRKQAAAAVMAQRAADAKAQAEARKAAEQVPSGGNDSGGGGAGQYAGMNCTEIGHSFMVTPGSDPDHDADNDGVACESQ
jgi:hypothetical protein